MASSSTSQTPYHEYEPIDPSEKFLLCSKKKDYFKVGCSKALLNCLLQRKQFTENIVLRLNPGQLETIYHNLKLQEFFNLNELNKWLGRTEANTIGSILAASETLSNFNIFLCPIDHTTYTVLVEKPTGFFCLINNSWVIIREIGGRWFWFDPRMRSSNELSESYLCMIIKQLLVENLPVFRISGEGFSRSYANHPITPSVIANPLGQFKFILENCLPYPPLNSDSNFVKRRLPSKPAPPLPERQSSRENVCRLQNALKGLDISSETTKKTKIKNTRGYRARSETRTQVLASSGHLQISSENQASFDWEWPPLPSLRTDYKRARSCSRIQKSQPRQYCPPRDVGENSERREIERKSRRDDQKPLVTRESACCICLESSPDHALVPCGHKCLCLKCKTEYLKKFNKCPICNKIVTHALKIYNT